MSHDSYNYIYLTDTITVLLVTTTSYYVPTTNIKYISIVEYIKAKMHFTTLLTIFEIFFLRCFFQS